MKNYKYELLPLAYKDLESITYYIKTNLNAPAAAEKFIDKLENKFEQIQQFPESGSKLKGALFKNTDYRKVVIDNYLAVYKIDEESKTIIIMRVFYAPSNYIDKL